MRIISGNFKGRKLIEPLDSNTRPLKDLTKESIFNVIDHSRKFQFNFTNSDVLDIFSGVGSFGLECVSRGCNNVSFVESHRPALEILKKNIKKLEILKKTKVYEEDIFNFLDRYYDHKKFDLIFLDPPYIFKNINTLFNRIHSNQLLKKNGILILHRHRKEHDIIKNDFVEIDVRRYGISKIVFLKSGK